MREVERQEEKQAIARRAVRLVEPGSALLLTGGTTTAALAPLLAAVPDVTVVTNSLDVAIRLADIDVDLVVLGGALRRPELSLLGSLVGLTLGELHVDHAIMGVYGVDAPQRPARAPARIECETDRRLAPQRRPAHRARRLEQVHPSQPAPHRSARRGLRARHLCCHVRPTTRHAARARPRRARRLNRGHPPTSNVFRRLPPPIARPSLPPPRRKSSHDHAQDRPHRRGQRRLHPRAAGRPDLRRRPRLPGRSPLVDVDEVALGVAVGLAELMVQARGAGDRITVRGSTDRTQALPGADFVVTCVGVGGRRRVAARPRDVPGARHLPARRRLGHARWHQPAAAHGPRDGRRRARRRATRARTPSSSTTATR